MHSADVNYSSVIDTPLQSFSPCSLEKWRAGWACENAGISLALVPTQEHATCQCRHSLCFVSHALSKRLTAQLHFSVTRIFTN